jgi:hypothetical protein
MKENKNRPRLLDEVHSHCCGERPRQQPAAASFPTPSSRSSKASISSTHPQPASPAARLTRDCDEAARDSTTPAREKTPRLVHSQLPAEKPLNHAGQEG